MNSNNYCQILSYCNFAKSFENKISGESHLLFPYEVMMSLVFRLTLLTMKSLCFYEIPP